MLITFHPWQDGISQRSGKQTGVQKYRALSNFSIWEAYFMSISLVLQTMGFVEYTRNSVTSCRTQLLPGTRPGISVKGNTPIWPTCQILKKERLCGDTQKVSVQYIVHIKPFFTEDFKETFDRQMVKLTIKRCGRWNEEKLKHGQF